MTFHRNLWHSLKPDKPCPTCEIGILRKPNNETFLKNETASSDELSSLGYQSSEYIISSHFKCSNCKEIVAFVGILYEENYPSNEDIGIQSSIKPISFYPAPKIIKIPKSCPQNITKLLEESFSLYWIDLSSCANKIRISIEVLLDELNIHKTATFNNKIKQLTLHERLLLFEKQNNENTKLLMATKWIGNAGSHTSEITKDDILDAYELLQFYLERKFNDKEERLIKISETINTTKKPRNSKTN